MYPEGGALRTIEFVTRLPDEWFPLHHAREEVTADVLAKILTEEANRTSAVEWLFGEGLMLTHFTHFMADELADDSSRTSR